MEEEEEEEEDEEKKQRFLTIRFYMRQQVKTIICWGYLINILYNL